jgi:hypothetical protein
LPAGERFAAAGFSGDSTVVSTAAAALEVAAALRGARERTGFLAEVSVLFSVEASLFAALSDWIFFSTTSGILQAA